MKQYYILFILSIGASVTEAQNIGIGITTPQHALEVNGRLALRYISVDSTAGILFNKSDNTPTSFTGQQNDTIWSISDYAQKSWKFGFDHKNGNLSLYNSSKGISLNAADRPLITRGWDPFLHGANQGIGRWGLFMDPYMLTVGIPDIPNRFFTVTSYDTNSNRIKNLFVVNQNGNVGINGNFPQYPLDVNGRIRLRYTDAINTPGIWFSKSDSSLTSFLGEPNDSTLGIYDYNNSSYKFFFDHKNGNLGIGTVPLAKLHVNVGTNSTIGLLVTGAFNGISSVPDLGAGTRMMFYPGKSAFRAGSVNGAQWDNINVGNYSVAMGSNSIASGQFSTALGNSFATGEVATSMGNSTASGLGSTAIGLKNTASACASLALGRYNDSIIGSNSLFWVNTDPLIYVGNGTADNARSNAMVVLKNGNMGLGVSSPIVTLHVKGSENIFSGANTHTGNFYNGNSNLDGIEMVSNGTDAYVGIQRAIGYGLHITKPNVTSNNGLVGFLVNGIGVGSITTNGTTTSYNTTSDARLKENLTPTHFGLETLLKINVKDYNYKSDIKKTPQTGFIAQQLYQLYPQAVQVGGKDEKTDPWMVDYSKITPLLVVAVQDQQKIIEEQKEQIKTMNEKLEALTKAVNLLSRK